MRLAAVSEMSVKLSFAQTFMGNVVVTGSGLFTGIVLARSLGPAGRGQLAAITIWTQVLATLLFASVNDAIVLRIGGKRAVARSLAWSALILGLLLGVLAAGVAVVALPMLLGPERRSLYPIARTFAAAFLPVQLVFAALLALVHGMADFAAFNRLRVLPSLAYFLLLGALWLGGAVTVETALFAQLIATIIALLVFLQQRCALFSCRPAWVHVSGLLRSGLRIHGAPMLLVLTQQMDRLAAVRFLGDTAVGLYAVATSYVRVALGSASSAVKDVSLQRIGAARVEAKTRGEFIRGWRAGALLLGVGAAILAAAASTLIPWVYGREFVGSVRLAQLLAFAVAMALLREIGVRNLRALGAPRAALMLEVAALVVFAAWIASSMGRSSVDSLALGYVLSSFLALSALVSYLAAGKRFKARQLWNLSAAGIKELVTEVDDEESSA